MIAYINFLRKSGNQHGLHSPFVFRFLTEGLYKRDEQWRGVTKQEAFPFRVLAYFKPQTIYMQGVEGDRDLSSLIQVIEDTTSVVDFIWIDNTTSLSAPVSIEAIYKQMHNDSILMIAKSSKSVLWEQIVNDERFIVTIDFYHYGVVAIRKEQLKQHFFLRM